MQRKEPKARCEKRMVSKSSTVCRLYSDIQSRCLDFLEADQTVESIRCNMPLDNFIKGDYTSDFYCRRTDGTYMVRECIDRRHLTKPMTIELLDASREYWRSRGVTDWGIVINKEGT